VTFGLWVCASARDPEGPMLGTENPGSADPGDRRARPRRVADRRSQSSTTGIVKQVGPVSALSEWPGPVRAPSAGKPARVRRRPSWLVEAGFL